MCSLDCELIQKSGIECVRRKHIASCDYSAFRLSVNHIQAYSCHLQLSCTDCSKTSEQHLSGEHFQSQVLLATAGKSDIKRTEVI